MNVYSAQGIVSRTQKWMQIMESDKNTKTRKYYSRLRLHTGYKGSLGASMVN